MIKLKYLNDKDPWMLGEDIPDCDLFFAQIWLTGFTNQFAYPSGRAYKKMMTKFSGQHLWFHFGTKDSYQEGEMLVEKFIKNPAFTTKINKQIIIEADKLRTFADSLPQDHLSKLNNDELWQIFKKHDEVHTHYYRWCWIPVAVDMFHDNLTERLKKYLRGINVSENKLSEYFVLLTQPTKKSLIQTEHEEFLRIAAKILENNKQRKIFRDFYKLLQQQAGAKYGLKTHTPEYEQFLESRVDEVRDKIAKNILKLIARHYQKYYYVKFMWVGKDGVYSFDHYLKEMVKLVGSGVDAKRELVRLEKEFKQTLQKRLNLIKKLKIKNPWRTIIDSWGDFMVTKIYRRYAQIYEIYQMQPLLKQIAKRLKITHLQVRFMLLDEIKQGLLKNKINRMALKERTKFCVFYNEKGKEIVFIGARARALGKKLEMKEHGDVREIKGQTGCIGKASGEVKIIIRPKDMNKMKPGDILVSIATDPDIVPAMKKAAAIVTEQGGVTSHAAIVSREMNIPCVIGTKIATRVLKDGDMVEVDATKGTVKKI